MAKKLSKNSAKDIINDFFKNLDNSNSKQVKKIKKISMSKNLKLGEKRKLFCKKCLSPYKNSQVKIKKGFKTIKCNNCKYMNRWKIKSS